MSGLLAYAVWKGKCNVVKKPVKSVSGKTAARQPWYKKAAVGVASPFVRFYARLRHARASASHQSFVLTRRRDTPSKPKLEGFIAFTVSVFRTLWEAKGLFSRFLALYFVLAVVMVGVIQGTNMETINTVIDSANEASSGAIAEPLTRAFVVVTSSLSGSLNSNLTEVQQFYMLALYIFVALVTVWLLRQQLASKKVTLRDGLYSAGAPLIALYVLVAVALLQLIPVALAILAYTTAVSGGFINGGIEAAMFSVALFLAGVLTLYFMLTTLFALMIATIPGTYPFKAYATAKKIIIGQRLRLLMRLFWMALVLALIWYVVLIPVALVVNAFGWNNTLVIPVAVQVMTGFLLIYGTSYCYLLYRRMIDDPVAR